MSESVFTAFGGLQFPVTEADVTDSLSSLDPARDRMLAWFAAAINAEFSSAWTEATNALPGNHQLIGTSPVQDTLPLATTNLKKALAQRKSGWPLLVLHRVGEAAYGESFTLEEDTRKQSWHLHWILAPLDLEGERRICDLGQAIGAMLKASIRRFGHPAYESGANQIEAAGLGSLELETHLGPGAVGFDDDEDDSIYTSTVFVLNTTEYTSDITDHMQPFAGFDVSLDVGGAGETDISPDFIEASTDPAYQNP